MLMRGILRDQFILGPQGTMASVTAMRSRAGEEEGVTAASRRRASIPSARTKQTKRRSEWSASIRPGGLLAATVRRRARAGRGHGGAPREEEREEEGRGR